MQIKKQINIFRATLAFVACVVSAPSYSSLEDDLILVAKEAHIMYPANVLFSMPDIRFEDPKLMYEKVCKDRCMSNIRIIGMYKNNVIILRNDFDIQNDFDVSYFVHEMVHHFQELTYLQYSNMEVEDTCLERYKQEFQAYMIQNQWLMKRGMGFPMKAIIELSRASAYGCMTETTQ